MQKRFQQLCLGAVIAFSVFGSGCATVTRGTEEALVVESEPSGATVRLSTGEAGTTPTSFKVKRKGDLIVSISKPGYKTSVVKVTSQIAETGGAALAGNLIYGGVVGAAVDASTGAAHELKPNPVRVKLNRL